MPLRVAASVGSASPEEATDRGHHLFGPLVLLVRRSPDHTGVSMAVQEAEGHLVESRLGGADLGQDVDAVAIVLDHALDPADLAFDATQPGEQLVLGRGVAPRGRVGVRHKPESSSTSTP